MSRSKGKSNTPRLKNAQEAQRRLEAQIKQRQEQADTLRQEREHLQLAERAGRVGVFDWDLETGALFSTGELEKLFGVGPGELGGRYEGWARLVHPEDLPRLELGFVEWLQSGRREHRWEYRLVRPDGEVRWLEARAELVRDAAGHPRRIVGTNVDLTERRQMEQALRESEERYRNLLELAPDAVMVHQEGHFVYVNAAAVRFFRAQSVADLLGRSRLDVVAPEDHEMVRERARQVLASGGTAELRETRLVLLDGQEVIAESAVGRVTWMGQPAVQVIVRDVSERKRAEANLRASEERFRLLAEAIPEFIWSARADGVSDYYNPQFLAYLGKTAAEMEGWTWLSTLHPEDQQSALRAWRKCLETGQEYRSEFRIRGTEGSYRWFLSRAMPLRAEGGQVTRWYGIVSDIDDHRRGEETLRRSEAWLAQAIRVAGLGTFEHDHHSGAIECSEVLRQLYGFGPDQAVTLPTLLARVMTPDRESVAAAIRRAHAPAGDGLFELEHRILRPDGSIRWVSVRSETFFEGYGSERRPVRTIGAVLDVTERKKSQSGLEHLVTERTAKLEEMVAELEHMSYSMVHSMRAPLRAIQSFADLIERREEPRLSPPSRELFERMTRSVRQMDQLITDTLNYNKAVRSRLPLRPTNVSELLLGVVRSYAEFQAPQAELRLEGQFPWVLGNETGLTQCFSELLRNAVKFVPPGTLPRVRVWAETRAACVRIWVEDNGTGLPPEGRDRVFEMFQRMHGSEYEGTGIGLALVRKLVERMGGRVGVESQPGRGSRFWVELTATPQVPGPAAAVSD